MSTDSQVSGGADERAEPESFHGRTLAASPTVNDLRKSLAWYRDVLGFTVYADRKGIPEAARPTARDAYFSKPRACLRASDLGKRYGWGIHFDSHGRVALYGVESEEYEVFVSGRRKGGDGRPMAVKKAMRSRR